MLFLICTMRNVHDVHLVRSYELVTLVRTYIRLILTFKLAIFIIANKNLIEIWFIDEIGINIGE